MVRFRASAGKSNKAVSTLVLHGDRWFESISLQRRESTNFRFRSRFPREGFGNEAAILAASAHPLGDRLDSRCRSATASPKIVDCRGARHCGLTLKRDPDRLIVDSRPSSLQVRFGAVMADVGRPEGKRNMATLDKIGQEKQRVSERLARLDTERAQLADQLGELEIAERVLTRFGRAERTKRRQRAGLATTAPAAGGERSARDTPRLRKEPTLRRAHRRWPERRPAVCDVLHQPINP
jgi:hypothetical protein